MSSPRRPVIVKRVPEAMNGMQARAFYNGTLPDFVLRPAANCARYVQMRHGDSVGVYVLLCCMRRAMMRDGDITLAEVLPQTAAVLELARIGRLFENERMRPQQPREEFQQLSP